MRNQSFPIVVAVLLFALVPLAIRATEQFWDPDGVTPGTSVSGTWNTATANWTATKDSGLNTVWTQGNDANFGLGGTYTVTLAEPISLGNLTATGTAGGLTIAGTAVNNLTLGSSSTFNITNSSRTVTVSAPIAGTFDLTKSGNGGLTLSGANTYSGGTTLAAGTATLGVDSVYAGSITSGPFGTGPVNVTILTPSTTVTLSPSGARILDNPILLNTNLTIGGSAALTFRNGGWQVNSFNRTVTVNNSADTTLQNLTDDSTAHTLTKAGSGRLVMMTTDSPFLGGITASAGTLVAGNATPFATNNNNTITVNSSTLDLNGFNVRLSRLGGNANGKVLLGANTLTVGCGASSEFSGVISGTGGYVKVGSTSQVLSGTNTFTGGILITESVVYFPTNAVTGSPIALGPGPNIITISGTGRIGASRNSPSISIVTNRVVLNNVGPTAGLDPANGGTFILSGQASGSGGFLRYTQGSGIATLAGDNTFTGGVEVDARTLGLGHKNALGTGPFTIGNPTVPPANTIVIGTATNLSGSSAITNVTTINQNFTISATNNLELSGPMTVANAITLTAIGDSPITFSGVIDGPGGFTKAGANSLIFSGANTYAGATIVSDGTLLVNNATGSGTALGAVTVISPGILGGTGTIAGQVLVSGGFISPGSSAGKLTLQNGLDMSGSGTETWELAASKDDSTGTAGTDFDQIALTGGNLNLGANATLSLGFIGSANAPSVTNAFWRAPHTWTVVKLTAPAANSSGLGFGTINNGSYSTGNFTNSVGGDGSILLSFAATPTPSISTVARSGNDVNISFVTANGSNYRVEYTTSLFPANWQLLQNVTGTGGSVTVTDANPADPQRFYRVVLTD